MSKHNPPLPMRTSAEYIGEGWFILDDFGEGKFQLRMTPEGMALLNDYGEYMNPLNAVHEREFIALCSLIDQGLCMAIDMTTKPDAEECEPRAVEFDPDDDFPF